MKKQAGALIATAYYVPSNSHADSYTVIKVNNFELTLDQTMELNNYVAKCDE